MKEYKTLWYNGVSHISESVLNKSSKEGWVLKFVDRSVGGADYIFEREVFEGEEESVPFPDDVPNYREVLK